MWRPTGFWAVPDPVYSVYTADLVGLVQVQGFRPCMLTSDDTQIYGSCRPSAVADFQVRLSACIDDVAAWMPANRLQQLNTRPNKTDLLWCATARRRHQLPTSTALRIGSDFVNSSTSVRNLGIYFDADLFMRCNVQRTVVIVASPFYASCAVSDVQFRRLCTRRSLSRPRLVTAGLRQCFTGRLTRLPVQPSAVGAQCYRTFHRWPVTLGPHQWHTCHWLEGPERVQYKLTTVMYRSLNGTAPSYLAADLRRKVLFYLIPQFIYESKSERIIEISPHLPKLS